MKKQPGVIALLLTGCFFIVLGGILSAFLAKTPTETTMWSIAFLVLILGAFQCFLGFYLWMFYKNNKLKSSIVSYILFNVGGLLVIAGVVFDNRLSHATPLGCIIMTASLIIHLLAINKKQTVLMYLYYLVLTVIFVSIPIGFVLSI